MRKVKFKPFPAANKYGQIRIYDPEHFDAEDLVSMLSQPLHLTKVNFKTGHEIWGDHLSYLFNLPDDPDAVRLCEFVNLGFAKALASLGYRVVPDNDEFIVF